MPTYHIMWLDRGLTIMSLGKCQIGSGRPLWWPSTHYLIHPRWSLLHVFSKFPKWWSGNLIWLSFPGSVGYSSLQATWQTRKWDENVSELETWVLTRLILIKGTEHWTYHTWFNTAMATGAIFVVWTRTLHYQVKVWTSRRWVALAYLHYRTSWGMQLC